MDGDGGGRNREAMEAARQYAAFVAAAMPPASQQAAFYPSTAGVPHSWPPAFSADPSVAASWFTHLAAAAAQGGGSVMPHTLPFAAALQQLQQPGSATAASLPQPPNGNLTPFDRYQASRSWLQHISQPSSLWPMMLPSHQSLMMPGSAHWPLYRPGLASTSVASSPFSFRGAPMLSEDNRAGSRPPAGSTARAELAATVSDQQQEPRSDQHQEPLLLGSSRHTYQTAGLHAFLPYSRSRTSSPIPGSNDTCLDLSMPRASNLTGEQRGRVPPAAARGAPSPPAAPAAEAAAPPSSVPLSSTVTATASVSSPGSGRAVPVKAEREASKRSSIPVGIAVAWQRRQESAAADLVSVVPRADASGQQPVPAIDNKTDLPGTGDEPPTLDQQGLLKANIIALENGSTSMYKPALPSPAEVHFGLPLSLALPTESVIKASHVTAKDLPRELTHDPLPQLHPPSGQPVVAKDTVVPLTQLLHSEIPKITVSGADSGMIIILKTEDSTDSRVACLREKLDAGMTNASEPAGATHGLSLITSSSTVPNVAASDSEAERVLTGDAGSSKASAEQVAAASVRDLSGNVTRCDDTSRPNNSNGRNEVDVVEVSLAGAEENEDDVLETGGRVLRAARRDATKNGGGIMATAKQTSATPGSTSLSKLSSKSGSSGKTKPKKKKAKMSADDGIDYTIITFKGVKYNCLKGREVQALYKRVKERQRTLARSVQSYDRKIAKLDLMDDFEASTSENRGHDNDVQPSAGPSISGGALREEPVAPGVISVAEGPSLAECIGGSSSEEDKKKKKKSSKSRRSADAATTAAAGDHDFAVSARCTASASTRVAAAVATATPLMAAAAATAAQVNLCVSADDLVEGAQLLVFIRGLPHEATVVCIEPPSVYGVLLVGQRSARPRVYARDDLLRDAYRDVVPTGIDVLRPGTRVCAYWSNQFGYLYPGVITAIYNVEAAAAAAAPFTGAVSPLGVNAGTAGPGGQSSRSLRASIGSRSHTATGASIGAGLLPLVDITFDDGDSGKFPLEQIRLLPADFPHTPVPHQQGYDDELSVVPVERRRSMSRATVAVAVPSTSAALRSPSSSSSGGRRSPTRREGGDAGRAGWRQPVCSVTSVCTVTSSTGGGGVGADDGDVFEDSDDEPLQLYRAKRARESFLACDGEWEWSGPVTRRREYSSGGGQGRHRHREIKDFYKEIRRGDEVLKVGDCAVFVRREEDKPPYVGKILSMWQGRRSHRMVVKVQWFYHPEEIEDTAVRAAATGGGVKDLTGALFESEHVDENSVQTISHRCQVLAIADYQKEGLHVRPFAELMQHTAFYVAGKYDAAHSQVVSFLSAPGVAAVGN